MLWKDYLQMMCLGRGTCPFCKSDGIGKTNEEIAEELMKRAEANDAAAIYALAHLYDHGHYGLLQDQAKALELWKQAAELGSSMAHYNLGVYYYEGGHLNLKKAKFHYGWTRSRKMQPWNNKGSIRTCGTSY